MTLQANMKNTQQPNNPMFKASSNGDNGLHAMMSTLMNKKLEAFRQNSFNSFGGGLGEGSNFQEMGKPTNMQLGSMSYSTQNPSVGLSNGIGSYKPQKKKNTNYPYADPVGLSEDEANKIRNKVLQKSNLYREKYNLAPFTLDDQVSEKLH